MPRYLTIHKWDETFENADTRKRQRLGWYLAPSGMDSRGYLALVSRFPQDQGMMAFGVFHAICQLSATLGKSVRGRLKNTDGEPMEIEQIATLLRLQICHLSAALEILTDPRIGWLRWVEIPDDLPPVCQSHPGFVKGEGEGEGEGTLSLSKESPPAGKKPPPRHEAPRHQPAPKNDSPPSHPPSIEECETVACNHHPANKIFAASVAREFHGIFTVKDWQTNAGDNLLHNGKWRARLLQMLEEKGRNQAARFPGKPSAQHGNKPASPRPGEYIETTKL